jgi:hypothetical protein
MRKHRRARLSGPGVDFLEWKGESMSILSRKADPEQRPMSKTAAVPPGAGSTPGYGIEEAIQLMRALPNQNADLVVRVVRATLASLNVQLTDIIEGATRKQQKVQEEIAGVRGKIADLEKQLDAHRREIAALDADLNETTRVKERFQEGEKAAGARPPPIPGNPPVGGHLLATTLLSHPPKETTRKE